MKFRLAMDVDRFWDENRRCMGRFDRNKLRTPVSFSLGEDFIKWLMGVQDHARFYLDFDYQQQLRNAAGRLTMEHLGIDIGPGINLGTTTESIFGGEVEFPSNAPPWIRPVARTLEEAKALLKRLPRIDVLNAGTMPRWFEYRARVLKEYGFEIHGGGGAHGAAELVVLVCGAMNLGFWIKDEPAFMREFTMELGHTMARWNREMQKTTNAGAPGGFSVSNDSAGLLSPDDYFEFSFPVEKMYYDQFAPGPTDTRYYHADSRMTPHLSALGELRVTGVNLGPLDDIEEIRRRLPQTVIHGQVPPMLTINGTPDDVYAACCSDIRRAGGDGGMVLTTAGGLCAGSWDHLRAFMAAAVDCGNPHSMAKCR